MPTRPPDHLPGTPCTLDLACHPATPATVVSSLSVSLVRQPDGSLFLHYCLRGDMARLRLPDDAAPERRDLLWEHTCFEAFVHEPYGNAYREFNFSPSSQWALYFFADYRQRTDPLAVATEQPRIVSRCYAGRLEVDATIPASLLPAPGAQANWRLGLSAVVESDAVDGSHSYWALAHPAARPDFHHADGHTLRFAGQDGAR